MNNCVLLAVLALGGSAYADAFEEYGARGKPRAAAQLQEAGCEVAVELRGALATVEVRQTFVNGGPEALAASYEFALPRGAVLIGAAFAPDARLPADAAVPVRADTAVSIVKADDALGPDPAFVRFLGDEDGAPTYRAVVQPWATDRAVQLVTRYAEVAEIRAGALRLALPGREAAPRLAAACRGTIRATPGPGARVSAIRVDATETKGARATFSLEKASVELAAVLDTGPQPLLWTQRESLGAGWVAQLATVIAPRAPRVPGPPARAGGPAVVFVLDGSRSMELVGHREVARVMRAIAGELPTNAVIEAVVFGRTTRRVFGELEPLTPVALDGIENALVGAPAANGTDLASAIGRARVALGAGGGAIVVITDGVLGDTDATALEQALGDDAAPLAIHAIVLDPARTQSPGIAALGTAIAARGGALVELAVGGAQPLDLSRDAVATWLRPGVFALAMDAANADVPASLPAGGGFTHLSIAHAMPAPVLTGRFGTGGKGAPFRVAAAAAPTAPIAALALVSPSTLYVGPSPTAADEASAQKIVEAAREAHAVADEEHAFAVLARGGKLAASRRALVEGRGRYDRAVAFGDSEPAPLFRASHAPAPSAIAKDTLERLFREQLAPRAYACYQRALGLDPALAGEVRFELFLGRGEVSSASVLGAGDAQFHACLADAAFELEPPIPDFAVNADDQTVARYALAFDVRDSRPVVVPGDADSATPIDIDRIRGGIPGVRAPVKVDTSTPLSGMEPTALGTGSDPAAPPKGPKAKPAADPEDPKWPILHGKKK